MTSLPPLSKPAIRGRLLFFAIVLSVLGLTLFLVARRRPLPDESTAEVHRTNLALHADGWHFPGKPEGFTGFLLDTYAEGTLKSRSAVSNGLLQGLSQGWHTNGQLQIEEQFMAGTSHGLRTKWHSNGQKLSEVHISRGKLEGTFHAWHDNGQPSEEVELKDGQPDGTCTSWYPNGALKSQVTLRNGKIVAQQFYAEGKG